VQTEVSNPRRNSHPLRETSKEETIMSFKQAIKKLRGIPLWDLIYNKWKMKRHRSNDEISLEQCRREALLEYYRTKEQIKYEQRPSEHSEMEKEPDYYVVINGRSMLNSTWQRMKQIQREKGTSPSTHPDEELRLYLLSLFRDEEPEPRRSRVVDL